MRASLVGWASHAIHAARGAVRRLALPVPPVAPVARLPAGSSASTASASAASAAACTRDRTGRFLGGLSITLRLDPTLHTAEDGRADMPSYYAVRVGHQPGVYKSWAEAQRQVKGFPSAKHKKFASEAEARAFLDPAFDTPPSSKDVPASLPTRASARAEPYARPDPAPAGRGKAAAAAAAAAASDPPAPELPTDRAALKDRGFLIAPAPPHRLIVYTDGSSLSNGTASSRAGLGVYWGEGEAGRANLSERVPGAAQTNNRGELLSIIRAFETCPFPELPIEVRTDSQYAISCMTVFLPKWLRNGFLTAGRNGGASAAVKNADLIKHLLVLLRRRAPGASVAFEYVPGHSGEMGNERADRLARLGASGPDVPDRTDWLVPGDEDEAPKAPTEIHVDIDPGWLMTPEELKALEDELV